MILLYIIDVRIYASRIYIYIYKVICRVHFSSKARISSAYNIGGAIELWPFMCVRPDVHGHDPI